MSQNPPHQLYENMLARQIEKLYMLGDHKQADAVTKILHEHLMHKAQMGVYPPQVIYGTMDDELINQAATRPYTREEQLAMRMHWGRIGDNPWAPGFEHVAILNMPNSTVVHIWVVTKDGQSVVLQDEAPLFPSDTLITKLNMMKG